MKIYAIYNKITNTRSIFVDRFDTHTPVNNDQWVTTDITTVAQTRIESKFGNSRLAQSVSKFSRSEVDNFINVATVGSTTTLTFQPTNFDTTADANDDAIAASEGLNADRLNGQLPAYYLDYDNFTNKPTIYDIATTAEAEAGTVDNKYMTPLKTKEAILELSPPTDLTAVNSHIEDSTIHFTQNQISITESQISGLDKYTQTQVDFLLAGKVGTSSAQALHATDALSITGNVLSLNKANGTSETIDLSLYLDDTNLARIVSGTYVSGSQVLRFTRDDASTFDVDASMFFDDTNLVTSVTSGTGISVNQTTGAITVTNTAPDQTVTITGGGATTVSGTYPSFTISSTDTNTNNYLTGVSGSGDGTVTFTRQGLPDLTWNAAHSHSEYLTSLPSHTHDDRYYTETEVNSLLAGKQAAGSYAPSSHTHNELYERGTITYGAGWLQWTDQSGNGGAGTNGAAPGNPTNEWWHHIIMNHANSAGYYVDIAAAFHSDQIYFRRNVAGNLQSWRELIHSGNIGSQNVDKVDGYHIVVGSTGSDANTLYFVT